MTNLKITNEIRLADFLIIIILAMIAFMFHGYINQAGDFFLQINERLTNIEEAHNYELELIIE